MTYLQRSNHGRRRRILIPFVIVLVFSLLVVWLHTARSSLVSTPVYFLAYPIWKIEDFTLGKLDAMLTAFASKRQLEEEKNLLEQKLKAAELAAYTADAYRNENTLLHAALNRMGSDPSNFVLAYVLEGPPRTLYDTFIIDVGAKAGIQTGMRVMAEGVVFGEVVEVGGNIAKVRLHSAPGVQTEVLIGEESARVMAEGRGGGNFIIELPKGISVRTGEAVRLSGEGMPAIGIVGHIESKPSDPFDKVYIASPLNIFEVPFVMVGLRVNE